MGNTARFALPYPANTDPLANMAAAIQALANAVDGDLIKHAATGNNFDVTTTAQPQQPSTLKIITGRIVGSASGGLLNFTFPGGGFTNGVLGIFSMTYAGTSVSPVINSGALTKTGGQFYVGNGTGGGLTGSVTIGYLAIGY